MTSEYKVAKRPRGRVLVDYNQNAWGRTLASHLLGAAAAAGDVSTPVTWKEIEKGVTIEDFRLTTCASGSRRSAICGSRCCGRGPG